MDTDPPKSGVGTTPETHVFRVQFWRATIVGLVYTQLLFSAYIWVTNGIAAICDSVPLFSEWNLISYAGGSVAITLLLVPSFLVLVFVLPVKVSAETFACSNAFGTMVSVSWGEITRVRSLPIPGFPYLLVSTSGRWLKLWLPLCIQRFPELVEKVERYAGTDHPLFQALWVRSEQRP